MPVSNLKIFSLDSFSSFSEYVVILLVRSRLWSLSRKVKNRIVGVSRSCTRPVMVWGGCLFLCMIQYQKQLTVLKDMGYEMPAVNAVSLLKFSIFCELIFGRLAGAG